MNPTTEIWNATYPGGAVSSWTLHRRLNQKDMGADPSGVDTPDVGLEQSLFSAKGVTVRLLCLQLWSC
jgi:hypothetical protein